MKISKILAGMSAAALAASMMSLAAFADETATVKADLTGGTVSLLMRRTMTVLLQRQVFLQEQTLSFQMFAVLMLM